MDFKRFQLFETKEQIRRLTWALRNTPDTVDIFGDKKTAAKKRFRALAKYIHPDYVGDVGNEATAALNEVWEVHNADNPYIDLGSGDVATVYLIDGLVFKESLNSGDNDLIQHEAKVLEYIASQQTNEDTRRYFPILHTTYVFEGKAIHNLKYDGVIASPKDLYTLKQVSEFYNNRLDVKHIGWIWRRLLVAMGFLHRIGVIHGAITPDNILIDPKEHGLVLIDYVHASLNQAPIRTMSTAWEFMYPPEVSARETPLPALDVYMAARCMLWACEEMPANLRRYFQWCIQNNALARPDSFRLMLENFDEIIYSQLGWKREFVEMDLGVDWSWWDK